MESFDLNSVGNVEGYNHVQRDSLITNHIHVPSPSLVLKFYNMLKVGDFDEDRQRETATKAIEFIVSETEGGRIKTPRLGFMGMGFSILSDDLLNIGVWGISGINQEPHVLYNKLYGFNGRFDHPSELDIRKGGSFCSWELGIVAHEAKAWNRYLASERTEGDKKNYLNSAICGGYGLKMKAKLIRRANYSVGSAAFYSVFGTDNPDLIPRGVRKVNVYYDSAGQVNRVEFHPSSSFEARDAERLSACSPLSREKMGEVVALLKSNSERKKYRGETFYNGN